MRTLQLVAFEERRRKDFVTLAILTAGGEARIDGDVGSYVKYANAAVYGD